MTSCLCLALLGLSACAGGLSAVGANDTTAAAEGPGERSTDWLQWRGPRQNGTYEGAPLPQDLTLGGPAHRWTAPIPGGGTPVVVGDRLYTMGTRGEGEAIVEVLAALDMRTGAILWERRFPDFLSDIIYERYAIGSPAVDPASGAIFSMTSAGLVTAHSPTGERLWTVSLMESFGRLTFPNGRTGSPTLVGDLVIVRGITAAWGQTAPGRDRLFALEAGSGRLVWTSTPGERPIDSSFSTPLALPWGDQLALLTGTGCGNLVAVNARTGALLWRKKISRGGVNASPVVRDGWVSVPHGKGRLGSSKEGGFVSFPVPTPQEVAESGPVLPAITEEQQIAAVSFSSSPVPVWGGLAQVTAMGDVLGIAPGGPPRVLWTQKLSSENLHASPLSTEERLYVPLSDGTVHVISRAKEGAGVQAKRYELDGACLGAPSASRGRLFIQTRAALHAFGDVVAERRPARRSGLQMASSPLPAEIHARPGDQVSVVLPGAAESLSCAKKTPAGLKLSYRNGALHIASDSAPGGCVLRATTADGSTVEGVSLRVRVSPGVRYAEDFESLQAGQRPPGWWLGAGKKWVIGEMDGGLALEKTLGHLLFQRATTLFGHPDARDYTLSARVRSDGNRRGMGSVGLVNQRYLVALDGNRRELVVSSNYDRLHRAVPFRWKPNTWYLLKTRVDLDERGVATIRAKAWPSDTEEPETWTTEVMHEEGHGAGSPGLYGFSPQAQHKVYIDDIQITPSAANPKEGGS